MARIRSIKPEMWADEKLARLSRDARLLFVALIGNVDDAGRMRGNPLFVRSQCFPYDADLDIEELLSLLAGAGFITRYEASGQSYLLVNNFCKHQKIDHPTASTLPGPPKDSRKAREGVESNREMFAPDMDMDQERIKDQEKEHAQSDETTVALAPAALLLADFIRAEWSDVRDPKEFAGRAQAAFPGVDLASEARKARGWEAANPRLVKKNHGRFLWNWLTRAQDNASKNIASGLPPRRPGAANLHVDNEAHQNAIPGRKFI